jgi:DNA-binding transcriptional ArsR family regulator
MRPLYHPSLEEITVQGIMHALSDPVRVRIVMELLGTESTLNCTAFLHIHNAPLPKSTLSKHVEILREAGLIQSERRGVELHNRLRLHDVVPKFESLVGAILQAYKLEIEAKQTVI